MTLSRPALSTSMVAALAIALFTSACARKHHDAASAPAAAAPAPVVETKKSEAPIPAPEKPRAEKPVKYLAVFQDQGENKGKCTEGVVKTFAWHQSHDPVFEGEIQSAIDALEAAKKSGEGVAEAGQALRNVYDVKMPTLLVMSKNYGQFACDVAGEDKTIGSDQLSNKIQTFKDYVNNEPAVPAGRVK